MAALVSSVAAFGANTTTTAAIDTTGANLICINMSGLTGAGGPTDSKSNTWTFIVTGGSNGTTRLFYCLNPTVGAGHTFTFTGSAGSASACIQVQAWSGITGFHNSTSSNGDNPGVLTPVGGLELFISGYEKQGGTGDVYSADNLFTVTGQSPFLSGSNFGGAMAYKLSSAAENPQWSNNHGTAGLAGSTMATFTMPAPTIAVVPPFVQAAVGAAGAGPTTVLTMPQDVTAGNFLIVCSGHIGGNDCNTAPFTDTRGLTFTPQQGWINVGGSQSTCCIVTAPITSSGPETITRTIASSNYPIVTWAVEVRVSGTPSLITWNANTSDFATTVNTATSVSAAANTLVIGAAADNNINPYTSVSPSGGVSGLGFPMGAMVVTAAGAGTFGYTFTKSVAGGRQSAVIVLMSYTPALSQQYGLPGDAAGGGSGQRGVPI